MTKQKEYFYVIDDHGYDGISQPLIITEDYDEAKKFFASRVKEEKQSDYGCDVSLFSMLKDSSLDHFDHSKWVNDKRVREWKKKNPGKELPVYRSGIICSTSPTPVEMPTIKTETYVSIEISDGEPDYDQIEKELRLVTEKPDYD